LEIPHYFTTGFPKHPRLVVGLGISEASTMVLLKLSISSHAKSGEALVQAFRESNDGEGRFGGVECLSGCSYREIMGDCGFTEG